MDTFFFIFSKLAWALLSPGNLLLIGFIVGTFLLWMHRLHAAKWILFPTAILAFAVLAYPVGDYLIRPLEKRFPIAQHLPSKIDGIIVLGGGEDLPRSLSWQQPQIGLAGDRYIAAKILADRYPHAPVIFTGGSGQVRLQGKGNEGSLAKQLLTGMGIDSHRLRIESLSRNTYENFKYTKPILPVAHGTYLLVTSAFHMPRSVGIARKFGIHVIPYPVDFRSNSDALRSWNFDLFDHLKTLEPGWKEWLGLTVYYWTGKTANWFPSPQKDKESS